jgi:predicted esterase
MTFRLGSPKNIAAILVCLLSSSAFGAVVLPKYNVSVNDVSVSGFSSGAHMAAQMHFAYSKTIKKGAGIVMASSTRRPRS